MSAKFWWKTVNVICKIGGIMNGKIFAAKFFRKWIKHWSSQAKPQKALKLWKRCEISTSQFKKLKKKILAKGANAILAIVSMLIRVKVCFALHHHLNLNRRRKLDSPLILYDGCKAASRSPWPQHWCLSVQDIFSFFSSNWKFWMFLGFWRVLTVANFAYSEGPRVT